LITLVFGCEVTHPYLHASFQRYNSKQQNARFSAISHIIKQKLASVSLHCKSRRSKTANIEFYRQIQCTEASDHIYFSQRPFINVKAIFLRLEFADKICYLL